MGVELIQFIKIPISWKVYQKDGKTYQEFHFGKGKKVKLLQDQRYPLYDKFSQALEDRNLVGPKVRFCSRVDYPTHILMEYETDEEFKFASGIFNIVGYIAPYKGCIFCKFKKEELEVPWCEAKEEFLTFEKKNCFYFIQKVLYKS